MKSKFYLLFLLTIFTFGETFSQKTKPALIDTGFFNYAYWNGMADKYRFTDDVRAEWLTGQKKIYLEELTHKHGDVKDLQWISEPSSSKKGYSSNITSAGPCTNIDFESGTFTGWTRSQGFNPLTNVTGCCPNPNGDQTIVTGAGLDPFGGFPVVYPGGGNFSLRLGSAATGGRADRIEQTFFVTSANANFTYRYAVVLNDPPGHSAAEKPRFTSEIIDTLGNPINCTTYSVISGLGIPGFTTSGTNANGGSVVSKAWTDVAVDLTPNIGQNVTIRFTVFDCGPSGHFAYAYLDGLCTNYATSVADTTCPNVPMAMCAPAGFSVTVWNGPGGIVDDSTQCILAVIPGTYTCTTLLIPGCPGPTFTHTLTLLNNPALSFTPVTTGVCATQYTMNSSMSIPIGTIVSHQWEFGDGTTSTATNPVHNYSVAGTYPVKLKAISNRGCMDSVINFITIFPQPNLSFNPTSGCVNSLVQFTNTSNITPGTITGYTWTLGNGPTSNLINPNNTYATNGIYTVTLVGISNQGCMTSISQTLSIFPPPVISFSAAPLCDINGTSFSPATSTAIVSGSLSTYLWDFGDGGTSTLANPIHYYMAPGIYTVNLSALSDHNCPAAISNTFQISPSPTVAFATTSVNACSPNFTFTNNSAISTGPITFTWSFGGTNTTTAVSPSYTFPSIGDYTVMLIGTSNMGCNDTAFQYISVYPFPIITLSVPASCESAIFTVTTSAVSGSVTSYNWNFGDPGSGAANTSTLQSPTHFYSSTNSYIITLNIVSNLNCPSTSITPITVFPNPVAAFTFTTLNSCSFPYMFTNNSSVSNIGASVISNYSWNFGTAGSSNFQNPGTINFPSNGSYTVSLTATTNHNCSNTMTANILVHPYPVLDFTVNPTCVNNSVTIVSSASISPIPSVASSVTSYSWNLGDGDFTNAGLLNQPPHLYPSAGPYTLNLSATSNMSCVSSVTHTLQIYPTAVSDFTPSANTCLGIPITFNSSNSISSGTIYAMNWNFGDGTIGSNPTTSHTYSISGTFPVNFSITTNNECLTIVTKPITIHPLPVVSFTANGGCLNTPSIFDPTVTIPLGTISSYTWNFGDGNSSNNQLPSNTYTLSGTYIPTLNATSNQGCIGRASNTVVINPLPNIAFSPTGGCVYAPIQFTNTSSIALGTVNSFTWNFGGGNSSNLTNPTYSYSPPHGPYTVTLSATSDLGCVKTETNTLTVHPYPQLTVTPIHNSCINDSIQINTNISIQAGAVQSYTLDYGDGGLNTFTNVSSTYTINHKYTAYNSYTIGLKAISTAGCFKDTTATIIVYPKPFVNFTASNFCYNSLTAFTNSSTIPNNYTIDSHYWQFNDGSATPTSTISNPVHTFIGSSNAFTTYPVSLTETSYPEGTLSPVACSMTTVKTITIYPHPLAAFSTNSVCLGKPTVFTNPTPSVNITGWSWYQYNNGTLSSLAQNPSLTYTAPGTYTAALIALNSFGCKDSITDAVVVYDNPTSGYTTNNHCLGLASIFTQTTTFPAGSSESQYVWTLGTTTLSSQTAPAPGLAHTFTVPGTYSVALTSISDLGCSNKYTSTITVYPLPTAAFFAPESCLNIPTQFTNLSLGSNNTYTWTFGDLGSGGANNSNITNPNHIYTNSGNYTATLQATNDKNCSSTTSTIVVIHSNPTALFTNTVICAGDKVAFTNLSTSGDGTLISNFWDFNGDNIFDINAQNPSYTYSLSTNYLVKLVVSSQYGCSDTVTSQVFANPKAIASISANKRNGCPTLCVDFINTSTITAGSFTSSWDFGDDGPTSEVKNASKCFQSSGNYDITLTLTSDIGCVTKLVNPGYISAFPAPKAGFAISPEQIDEDDPVITVNNQASSDANFIRYYVNDGSNFGTPNFTHYIKNLKQTKPMVVQVVKNQFGCSDTLYQVIDIKPAYVVYFPNVFTPNGDGTNDDFRPKGVGIIKFNMNIYDRWGHQVFQTNDITNTWDGLPKNGDSSVKQDIYTWKAQVTDVFNKNHFLVGHVTVIR